MPILRPPVLIVQPAVKSQRTVRLSDETDENPRVGYLNWL